MPELASDARFGSTRERAANQSALREPRFTQQTVAHWIAVFEAAGVPHAPINNYESALADPQVAHMQWVKPLTLPGGKVTRTFGFPLMLDGEGSEIERRAPTLGEH